MDHQQSNTNIIFTEALIYYTYLPIRQISSEPPLTYLCLQRPKAVWQVWWNLSRQSINGKIFEGEMFIRTLPTILLQIFCKIILVPKLSSIVLEFQTTISRESLNPSNAEATLAQSTRMQKFFENHLNPVILVSNGWGLRSTLRWVPICQGFNHFSVFLYHFILAKLPAA